MRIVLALALFSSACGFSPAAHAPFPEVQSRGGPLLAPLTLVSITTPEEPLAASLSSFADALAASDWWRAVSADYGVGPIAGVSHVVGGAITSPLSDHDAFDYVTETLAQPGVPRPDGKTLYVIYLPAGGYVSGNDSCQTLSGYHRAFDLAGDNLAVIQRCPSSGSELDSLTLTASHEIIEAATDPLGSGYVVGLPTLQPWSETVWASAFGGRAEVADLCEGTRLREGSFLYQRVFSNSAAALGGDPCLPALAAPYYAVSFDAEWYAAPAGTSLTIPFHAWSTAAMKGWFVFPVATTNLGGPFAVDIADAGALLKNGDSGALQVTIPAGTASGSYQIISLASATLDPAGDEDLSHAAFVGVHVP